MYSLSACLSCCFFRIYLNNWSVAMHDSFGDLQSIIVESRLHGGFDFFGDFHL